METRAAAARAWSPTGRRDMFQEESQFEDENEERGKGAASLEFRYLRL